MEITLEKLIDDFNKSRPKNEADIRLRFIDPLFILLGWDVRNEASEIESYRDVLVEEPGDKKHTGRPDYTFKIKRAKKFFVEAKKPSVDIRSDANPAIQVRNYGYWAGLPISILTDFEEFAVYDTRHKVKKKDDSKQHRLFYCRYTNYVKEWDFISETFSKKAVTQNSIETYIAKEKKATSRIDNDFLSEIEDWRKSLASNIALRNKDLSGNLPFNITDLNLAVQTIIDRIIFLKFAESRGIEPPEQFLNLDKTEGVYQSLDTLFLKADKKYNSGLFKRNEGRQFISQLNIDDIPFKKVFKFLSATSYGFQVLPIEILGSIYERFLGNSIYFTKGQHAKIEEKPETRKAGGVYYTPEYIVSYIVENTLGELLKKKNPQEVEKIRVLDPACGSGSFVVNAYEYLLNWHLEYYVQEKNIKSSLRRNQIYKLKAIKKKNINKEQEKYSKTYRLSIAEKQRILLNNIYGVDIDSQAVEVTKLSLLLKLMESEDVESEGELFKHSDIKHANKQMLPDLSDNIKCGNSLIGSDFYQGTFFPTEEKLKINVFDWDSKDGFAEIMQAGGFNVVIGNPPYVFGEFLKDRIQTKHYFNDKYPSVQGQSDTYRYFIEKSISVLCKGGFFSFIVPDALLARDQSQGTRELLMKSSLLSIYHSGQVFEGVGVSSVVFCCNKGKEINNINIVDIGGNILKQLPLKFLRKDKLNRFLLSMGSNEFEVIQKIELSSLPLGNYIRISRGEEIGKKSVLKKEDKALLAILSGEEISRYLVRSTNKYIFKKDLVKDFQIYKSPKIIIVKTGKNPVASIDKKNFITMQSLYNIQLLHSISYSILYLLANINCKLVRYFANLMFTDYKQLFPQFNQNTVLSLPIPKLDFSRPTDKAQHDRMVELVNQMLDTQKQLYKTQSPSEKILYQKKANRLDNQIDALVYQLHDLSKKEINIIEKGA